MGRDHTNNIELHTKLDVVQPKKASIGVKIQSDTLQVQNRQKINGNDSFRKLLVLLQRVSNFGQHVEIHNETKPELSKLTFQETKDAGSHRSESDYHFDLPERDVKKIIETGNEHNKCTDLSETNPWQEKKQFQEAWNSSGTEEAQDNEQHFYNKKEWTSREGKGKRKRQRRKTRWGGEFSN
ncbi:hypothetical protein RUM43_007729 [Polyplax serrata]|uniref:Uncharacterized protein n=1 Tax=Polyplax serrata TaxID=468196 RepID=A0AAN8PMY4_POLSC